MTPYQQGIYDRAHGRSYPAAYERWGTEAQQSYERGRLAEATRRAKPITKQEKPFTRYLDRELRPARR